MNASAPRIRVESAVNKLKARTRKPLASPSVLLNLNRMLLAPPIIAPAGSASVTRSVENPPPIPPNPPAGSVTVTVLLFRENHAPSFTCTLTMSG